MFLKITGNKHILILLLGAFVLWAGVFPRSLYGKSTKSSPPTSIQDIVEAKSALLVDVSTGDVIFGRNTAMRLHPASTTKLMTALLAYEKTRLHGFIAIIDEDTRVEPSHVPLKDGEVVSVADLMRAMLISSDNDAAMALARYTSGSVGMFIEAMNRRAAELGCTDTHFTNPHGLPDSREYTTSEDLLRIFNKVMEISELRNIAATKYYSITTQIGTQRLKNHNKLLGNFAGMSSAKTGWTYASRHTYAASCIRDGRELRLIILNSPNKWRDASALFNYGFEHLPPLKLPNSSPILASTTVPAPVVGQVSSANPTNAPKSTNVSSSVSSQAKSAAPATTPSSITNQPTTINQAVSKTNGTQASTNIPAAPATTTTNSPSTNISRPVAQKIVPHVVRKGDTLTFIASKYKCGVEDILLFNSINDIDRLKIGQVVYVPIGLVKEQGR